MAKFGKMKPDEYNILFILNDQERYFERSNTSFDRVLRGRKRLQKTGVTFTNHYINAAVCTSSRSVIYTGQHIQDTTVFDNLGYPWSRDLPKDIPTLGHMLTQAGYYSAYKGKWHLCEALEEGSAYGNLPSEELTKEMEEYGFHDYVGIGDIIGTTSGGYLNDEMIGAQTQRWLRSTGVDKNRDRKPWFKAVNLVNPHDVMYFNTDAPGQCVQGDPAPLRDIARAPRTKEYQDTWDEFRLPRSRHQDIDEEGRPKAHRDFYETSGALVGYIPDEDERWSRLQNFYFNAIRQTDHVIEVILDELEDLGLRENTIVVLTSDHGELGGAHRLNGKGATAYEEQNHVPLIISHPGLPQTHGQDCKAITSHLDLAPTLLAWTGVEEEKRSEIAQDLHGHDMTPLLTKGEKAGVNDLRIGALYCFNMFGTLDGGFATTLQQLTNQDGDWEGIDKKGFRIDFNKRGAIRTVFDGRYKYSRYFSPQEFNTPVEADEIFEKNDLELFDLRTDPHEMRNLAYKDRCRELLMEMNDKLNTLIRQEVGEDDGAFLPLPLIPPPRWPEIKLDL